MKFFLRKKELQKMMTHISALNSMADLERFSLQHSSSMPGQMVREVLLMQQGRTIDGDTMQYVIDQVADRLAEDEESYLPFLLTCASVAPLIGLFGTVWGLIHAFIRISEKQSADITVVAPGIAEALITTLAGLIVAIPALIMYNFLVVKVRNIASLLMQSADRIGIAAQKTLMR